MGEDHSDDTGASHVMTIDDLRARVAAGRAAVAQETERLTKAKQAAIGATTRRQPVEALVTARILTADDPEVVDVRAADAEARGDLTGARQSLSSAEGDLLKVEEALGFAKYAAERVRRMAVVERTAPEFIADLAEARSRLAAAEYVRPGLTSPAAKGQVIWVAKQRVRTLEAELDRRLAEAPSDEVAPATTAGAAP